MSMYFIKTPEILKRIYPNQVWSYPVSDKKLYLTFDDGPTPNITEWVLRELKKYSARATFFLVGAKCGAVSRNCFPNQEGRPCHRQPYLSPRQRVDDFAQTLPEGCTEVR